MNIEIYSDGSSNVSAGTGGWAYRILIDNVFYTEAGGYLPHATNNAAELYGAIEGLSCTLRLIEEKNIKNFNVSLLSDSKLVLGYANGTFRCNAPHLLNLYKKIRELNDLLNLSTKWIKGHSGIEHNEACDALAKKHNA